MARRRRRRYRSAKWYNRRGLPNKSEQSVVELGIPGLECCVGTSRYVLLRHPDERRYRDVRKMHWATPGEKPWRKHPDFAYGWRGPEKGGQPLLVVEVFGFGKYHTAAEARYVKSEYARAGVLCLVFSARFVRAQPEAVRRRICNAIASLSSDG